jgi:hypothetical protein
VIDSKNPHKDLYINYPGHNAYASEYYLAPGKGVIQTSFLYSESDLFQGPHCTKGTALLSRSTSEAIAAQIELESLYIDEQ